MNTPVDSSGKHRHRRRIETVRNTRVYHPLLGEGIQGLCFTRTHNRRQRRYSEDHIRRILHIKKLLWHDRFSIQGAKLLLRQSGGGPLMYSDIKIPMVDTHDLALFIARTIGNFFSNTGRPAAPGRRNGDVHQHSTLC